MKQKREFKFIPIKEFEWWDKDADGNDFMIGQYLPGMSYNCTRFAVHDKLREKCKEWEKDGLIKIAYLVNEHFEQIKRPQVVT